MARIVEGGLDDPRVISLLHLHVTRAHAETAPGSGHALDLAGLKTPDITFWSAWDRDVVLGVGALKRLAADHGEVKSMHTAEVARRRGIGSIMLRHIVDHAKAHGMARLSLETGSWDYFRPARALYQSHGFCRVWALRTLCARSGQRFYDAGSDDTLNVRRHLSDQG